MLDNAIAINEFQLALFDRTVADVAETSLYSPGAGHGHPPVWILGHLALCAELGQQILGGGITHREWLSLFGPGSSDRVEPRAEFTREMFAAAIRDGYRELRRQAAVAETEYLGQPHGIQLFKGTPIQTVGHAVELLLTNHFGFHLSQLSSCRRAAGHPALF
jgi:hypothetical protein